LNFLYFYFFLYIILIIKKNANFGAIYVVRVEFQWRYRHSLRRTVILYHFAGGAEFDWYFERLSWITYQLRMAKLV